MTTFKTLTSDDRDIAMELMKLWYPHITHDPVYLDSILNKPHIQIYVVFKDGNLIGGATAYILEMITRHAKELFIYEVGIAKAHQNKGYGKLLMKYIQDENSNNLSEAFIVTESDNLAANRLYQSAGYTGSSAQCYTTQIK